MKRILIILLLFVGVIANGQMFNYYHQRGSGGGGELSVIDTLGDYTINALSAGITDQLRVYRDTAESTGSIDSLYIWTVGNDGVSDSIKLVIYADDGDYPGALLGQTASVLSPTDIGGVWFGVPLLSSVNITSGNVYWFGFLGTSTSVYYQTTWGQRYQYSLSWGSSLPDPFPGGQGGGTTTYSLYGEIKN